jgi:sugar O-acyltransferase (sialic acid O-acetyltransferase NeuD family)
MGVNKMENLVIIGSGGLGREIASLFLHKILREQYNLLGFIDDFKPKGVRVNDKEVLGTIEWLIKEKPCKQVIIAFSDLQIRLHLINKLMCESFLFPTIIHQEAILLDITNIKIGNGSIIFPYAMLTTNIKIGDNVIVHMGAKIHHDTIVKDNCILMPNIAITGGAKIGNNVFLGTGTICPFPTIVGDNTIVKAGSIVVNDLI